MLKSIIYLAIICFSLLNFSEAETLKGVTVLHKPYNELKNGQLEGFANDLIKEIANIVGFNYTLELTPDGKYGVIVNNTINGMLGEVHSNRADFAIADITVTEQRRQYVDFTEPFIETGITILVHKNNAKNIHSFADLAQQTDIGYGTLLMGSSYHEMSLSTDPTLTALFRNMTNNPANLVQNMREGIERVNITKYAFFVEKPFAEYVTGIDCELTYIDDPNNYMPRQYAIALNKESNYTERFNSALKQLKSRGKIDRLRNRYWKKCGELYGVTVEYPPYIEMNNGKMEGFVVDLINKLSAKSNLSITLGLTPDDNYGYVDKHGKMTGMIGELYNGWADLAVADITITESRRKFVTFIEPFMESSLAILIRREYAKNITSFKDLADQTAIRYGILSRGFTREYFAQFNDTTIKKMNFYMEANPWYYVDRISYGLESVWLTPFAFIVESTIAEYMAGKHCDLTLITDHNNYSTRQYAIAVPKESNYLDQLHTAIIELKENGTIEKLKNRYWKKCDVLNATTIQELITPDLLYRKIGGFVADLMTNTEDLSGVYYSFVFSDDGRKGSFYKRKEGLIGDDYKYRVDFTIADIKVTESSKQLFDFTEPFVKTGLVILIHKDFANNISSFADLAEQTLIQYGMSESTHKLLAHSDHSTILKMYQQMEANPNNYYKQYADSEDRLTTTPFAMIVERPIAEQVVGRNCDLTFIVDQNLTFSRQFGIKLAKGSIYLDAFNSAIRQLKSSGRIDALLERYRKKCNVLKGVTVGNKPFAELSDGKLSGLAVDLMDEISALNNYSYTLNMQFDGKYGGMNEIDIRGMIGEVYQKLADFAIADITVSDIREKFVDFTEPLFETGVVLIIHKNNVNNISSFSDLAQQTNIKYGLLEGSSTYNLFKESADPTIFQLYRTMYESSDAFLFNVREGIARVKDNSTGFGFFTEGMAAQYFIGEDCDLTFIADPEYPFPRQYAIVLSKNSTYIQGFNSAISQLKANGVLNTLKDKYWKKCENSDILNII